MEHAKQNIPNVTVNELLEMLQLLYTGAAQNGISFRSLPTPFLWGPAGIGKSEAVRQLAERLQANTGKTVTVTDVRLLLFSPVDLRGIPVANEDKTFSCWLMPKIFDMNADPQHIHLLFLDELSAAPPSLQASAYQICLDRKVGEHALPDNCIVIAAGNRMTDQSVSYKMPKALCNRLMHFNIETNYEAWREWAVAHNIDSRIIGYLAFDHSKLCAEPDVSDKAYPTPRSWTLVSRLLQTTRLSPTELHKMIGACVGIDTALEFGAWVSVHKDLPRVSDVLEGRCTQYPQKYDALHAFTASLVAAIRMRKDTVTVGELENVCAYIKKFPTDFAMTVYKDLMALQEINLKLMKCPSCQTWLSKNKRLI